jgi:hypothetical protein
MGWQFRFVSAVGTLVTCGRQIRSKMMSHMIENFSIIFWWYFRNSCRAVRVAVAGSTVNVQIAPVSARQLKEMDGRVASST